MSGRNHARFASNSDKKEFMNLDHSQVNVDTEQSHTRVISNTEALESKAYNVETVGCSRPNLKTNDSL